MNRYKTNISLLIAFTLSAIASHAAIITVKQDGTGDYTTIQQGVNATQAGDTVLVWPGTYYENVVLPSTKPVTLASLYMTTGDKSYINNTIIDGNHTSSCVRINPGPSSFTTLYGFTCMNGRGYGSLMLGGGIYANTAKLNISFCIIKDNWAHFSGGGVRLWGSEAFFSGNVISNNHTFGHGGGISYNESTAIFDTVHLNSVFLNYAAYGCDLAKASETPSLIAKFDTMTVLNPDIHYVLSTDLYGYPVNDIELTVLHQKIEPVNADLYVSPVGDDGNSGTSPGDPLRSVSFAYKKTVSDSLHPNTIHLAPGVYGPSTTGEKFPLSLRSFVSLEGTDTSNTILDAENNSYFACGPNTTHTHSIRNITFRNGFGNTFAPVGDNAGIWCYHNSNTIFENLLFKNSHGQQSTGINALVSGIALFKNIKVVNSIGEKGLFIGNCPTDNTQECAKQYLINCEITGINPDTVYSDSGGGVQITKSYYNPSKVYISNLLLWNVYAIKDPMWPDGGGCAINIINSARVLMNNSTIGNCNWIDNEGGALGINDSAMVDLYNTIVFNNEPHQVYMGSGGSQEPSTLNCSYSDIEDGYSGIINAGNIHTLNWLSGNIDADPLWEETGDFPYALKAGSPCINTGTPMYEPGMQPPYIIQQDTVYMLITIDYDTIPLPSTDLAGNPRIAYGRIDMGAYEFADTTTGMTNNKYQIANNKVNIFPNPFTSNAFISFQTNKKGKVRTAVYNLSGQLVKKLTETEAAPGSCSITWDGTDSFGFEINPGTYIVSVEVNGVKAGSAKVVKKKRK